MCGYAFLGSRYWFRIPFRGILISLVLYAAAVVAAAASYPNGREGRAHRDEAIISIHSIAAMHKEIGPWADQRVAIYAIAGESSRSGKSFGSKASRREKVGPHHDT